MRVRVIPLLLALLASPKVDATVVRWERIFGGPDARDAAAAAYGNGKILVFGGRKGTTALGDTWLWNGTQWRPVTGGNAPSPRFGAAMAYDPNLDVFVLFGGTNPIMNPAGNTYHFDPNSETWRGAQGPGGGPQRAFHAMTYDRNLQAVVMFGGIFGGNPVTPELWKWDGTAWAIVPATGGATLGRSRHALAFDESSQSLVLYGGIASGFTAQDDAWLFKAGAWSQLSSAWTGVPRHSLGMVYDRNQQRVLIDAGRGTTGAAFDFVSVSNGTTTTMIYPPRLSVAQPPARFGVAMVYDEARKRVVVIGGSDSNGANLNDSAWEFFMTGQECTQPAQCGTGICVTGVCCLTPCDPPCRSCDQVNQHLDPNAIDGECRRVPPGKDPRFCNSVPGCEGACSEIATCIYPGASTRCGMCKACNEKTGECDQLPQSGVDPACKMLACYTASNQCRDYHDIARCAAPGQCAGQWRYCTDYTNKPDGTGCNCFHGTCYDVCRGGFCDRAWGEPQ